MNDVDNSENPLEQQLEKLRGQLRITQCLGLMFAIMMLIGFAQPNTSFDEITAKSVEIVDDDGNVRIRLGIDILQSSSLTLLNSSGTTIARLHGQAETCDLNIGSEYSGGTIGLFIGPNAARIEAKGDDCSAAIEADRVGPVLQLKDEVGDQTERASLSPRGIARWEEAVETFSLDFESE